MYDFHEHAGKPIKNLDDLYDLAYRKKAVITKGWMFSRSKPASWVLCLQGGVLRNIINRGLYEYITIKEVKKQKKDKARLIKNYKPQEIPF